MKTKNENHNHNETPIIEGGCGHSADEIISDANSFGICFAGILITVIVATVYYFINN